MKLDRITVTRHALKRWRERTGRSKDTARHVKEAVVASRFVPMTEPLPFPYPRRLGTLYSTLDIDGDSLVFVLESDAPWQVSVITVVNRLTVGDDEDDEPTIKPLEPQAYYKHKKALYCPDCKGIGGWRDPNSKKKAGKLDRGCARCSGSGRLTEDEGGVRMSDKVVNAAIRIARGLSKPKARSLPTKDEPTP